VANPFQSPSILSFCPGILGLERGLERIIGPARVVAYVEIEAFIIANLLAGMEARLVDCAPVWTDAKTFPAQHFHNKVHGIIGGYPCQPFSIAGNRQGTADPRHLWPHLQRSIEAIKPVWCFFENVDDHLNLGFDHVHQQLCDMGFAVETGIYSASEAGAPHQRQRLFNLGLLGQVQTHSKKVNWPTPDTLMDHNVNQNGNRKNAPKNFVEALTWPTPDASMRGSRVNQNGHQITLQDAIKKCPTPAATDYKGVGINDTGRDRLDYAVEKKTKSGQLVQANHKNIGKPRAQLNPAWVAQLMGTTSEKIFFVPLAIAWWSNPQPLPLPT